MAFLRNECPKIFEDFCMLTLFSELTKIDDLLKYLKLKIATGDLARLKLVIFLDVLTLEFYMKN